MLPDYLSEGLDVVFCGTAAGKRSGLLGRYYAGRGNRFWSVLHETGMTPVLLVPELDSRVLEFGIGLTDVAKGVSGMDSAIPRGAYAPLAVREVTGRFRPRALAFNGLNAARAVLGKDTVGYGRREVADLPPVWVLPSTSGAARRYFNIAPWQALSQFVRAH